MTIIAGSNATGQVRDLTADELDLVSGGLGWNFCGVDISFAHGKNADILVAKGTHHQKPVIIIADPIKS
jgi:hypothetical protein